MENENLKEEMLRDIDTLNFFLDTLKERIEQNSSGLLLDEFSSIENDFRIFDSMVTTVRDSYFNNEDLRAILEDKIFDLNIKKSNIKLLLENSILQTQREKEEQKSLAEAKNRGEKELKEESERSDEPKETPEPQKVEKESIKKRAKPKKEKRSKSKKRETKSLKSRVKRAKKSLIDMVREVNLPSSDNRKEFKKRERLEFIEELLKDSDYTKLPDKPLAKLYAHREFNPKKPLILISAHIDSLYKNYFSEVVGGEICGTFDNSICNGVVLDLMINSKLPKQVVVAFTGDEEIGSRGAKEAIKLLKKEKISKNIEIVIVLDVTLELYCKADFTIENYFVNRDIDAKRLNLKFKKQKELKSYIASKLKFAHFIKNALPDEALKYKKYVRNTLSFTIPCRVLGYDMHEDSGVAVRLNSLESYSKSLLKLVNSIATDVKKK
jgi:hypothetical protein